LASFFHGEGSGVPAADLKTPRSIQLKLIMDHYFLKKEDLKKRLLELFSEQPEVFNEKEGVFTTDWVLKLLKLRGASDLVDKALKSRANRTPLTSV
jgi:hypothetical protein